MITIDDRQIKRFERDLKAMAEKSFPFATQRTVNQMAFKGREFGQQEIRNNMITRNKWTERSVRYLPTRQLNIRRQETSFGSTADYLETQEFGGVERGKGKHGVVIPTSVASGEGQGNVPRRKAVRSANQMRKIQLRSKSIKARSRAQRNFIAVKEAAQSGRKFVFLDLQDHPGIYKVMGGKRKPRVKLIHDMGNRSVRIPANPWMQPAAQRVMSIAPGLYLSALKFQMKRQGLL